MKSLLFSRSVLGLGWCRGVWCGFKSCHLIWGLWGGVCSSREFCTSCFIAWILMLVCCSAHCSGSNLSDIPEFMGRRCAALCEEQSAAAPRMFKFCVLLASLCPFVCSEGKFRDHSQRECWCFVVFNACGELSTSVHPCAALSWVWLFSCGEFHGKLKETFFSKRTDERLFYRW